VLREQLESVRQRISQAAQRCGRSPAAITLIGVTKGIAVEAIQEAVALGLTDLGENRVQEARAKQPAIRGVRWHLIGHLQRNKAADAVELFEVIHSVDSAALAETLERHAATPVRRSDREPGRAHRRGTDVLVQVNVSQEQTKFGCSLDDAPALARAVTQLEHLRLIGLMTIAPLTEQAEGARPHFRRLRLLRDQIQSQLGVSSLALSMGMSHDFDVAIEEGADLIRVGTAIFGSRVSPRI